MSCEVSRLDNSVDSRGGAEPQSAKAVRNEEGLEEQRGSSLWMDEGHAKWDRRWSPETMHADVMRLEADENEGRGDGRGCGKNWEMVRVNLVAVFELSGLWRSRAQNLKLYSLDNLSIFEFLPLFPFARRLFRKAFARLM